MVRKKVTDDELVDAIEVYWFEHGYAPSVRDLGNLTGLTSSSTVHFRLNRLCAEGRITWTRDRSRTIRLVKEEET